MKLCVLIPAYNCAHVVDQVIQRIQLPGPDDEIIVVDDGSVDNTLEVAGRLPRVYAVRNDVNRGYGGTSQRLYELAAERGADVTINIHGDLGHRPEDIPLVLQPLLEGHCDIALGSRLKHLMNLRDRHGWRSLLPAEARQNMPLSRVMGHFGLTWFQNKCYGTNLHSFHEGMRGCSRPVIDWVLKNQFSTWYNYDVDLIVHGAWQGFRIAEVAVPPYYDGQQKSAAPSFRYGLRVVQYSIRMWQQRRALQHS
jgi:glycosyltransferase involved in cell wall biosynthesis